MLKGDACLEKCQVNCEYFSKDGSCKAIVKDKQGEAVRDESCVNEMKNSCCYTCPEQKMCEISCDYLHARISQTTRMNHEIANYEKSIEKLSVFYAEGKISEESYLRSVRSLESRTNRLEELKKNPESLDFQKYSSRLNDDESVLVERPSSAWYLLPFLFGLIGGLIGYVGTKDRDQGLADSLLAFGVFWTIVLIAIVWFLI